MKRKRKIISKMRFEATACRNFLLPVHNLFVVGGCLCSGCSEIDSDFISVSM